MPCCWPGQEPSGRVAGIYSTQARWVRGSQGGESPREEEETDGWSICSELAVAETALAVAAAACGGDDVLAWRAWKIRPGLVRRLC